MKETKSFNEIPDNMKRIQRILRHPEFKKSMEQIEILERERIFCGHSWEHLLDVARIAYINNLEQGYGFQKDVVYAAGLLHDVGKYLQYTENIPHHLSGEKIARQILTDAGFEEDEINTVCEAILTHRDKAAATKSIFGTMLYRADKISRPCYACSAVEECDWEESKKTAGVIA